MFYYIFKCVIYYSPFTLIFLCVLVYRVIFRAPFVSPLNICSPQWIENYSQLGPSVVHAWVWLFWIGRIVYSHMELYRRTAVEQLQSHHSDGVSSAVGCISKGFNQQYGSNLASRLTDRWSGGFVVCPRTIISSEQFPILAQCIYFKHERQFCFSLWSLVLCLVESCSLNCMCLLIFFKKLYYCPCLGCYNFFRLHS